MAVPKKRTSVSRKGLRRAGQHHKLYTKTVNSCPNCGEFVLPHRVCGQCGQYKGKQVMTIKDRSKKEKQE